MEKSNGLERSGLPIEVGRVAGFLASGFSSYVHGASIVVDGGSTYVLPSIEDSHTYSLQGDESSDRSNMKSKIFEVATL